MASTHTILDRLRATLDAAVAAELERGLAAVRSPVRIEVTGRAGVGRSALVAALGPVPGADVVETEAWDRPGLADPTLAGDVVVLAVLDPPRAADRAAAAAAGGRPVVVLTKADTVADPAGAASRAGARLGVSCLPVSAVGSVRGIDALRDALTARVAAVDADRASGLLVLLRALGGTSGRRDPVEEFLASDDGVRLAARASGPVTSPRSGDALAEARHWRIRMNTATDADSARTALARHRAAARESERRA